MGKKNSLKIIFGIVTVMLVLWVGMSLVTTSTTIFTKGITDRLESIYDIQLDVEDVCGNPKYCEITSILKDQDYYQNPIYSLECRCNYPIFGFIPDIIE